MGRAGWAVCLHTLLVNEVTTGGASVDRVAAPLAGAAIVAAGYGIGPVSAALGGGQGHQEGGGGVHNSGEFMGSKF